MKRVSVVRTHFWRFILLSVAILGGMFSSSPAETARAAIFVVNSTADTVDSNLGNGVCADSIGNCTLRAAIQEANALPGDDSITVPAGTYTLSRDGYDAISAVGDLDITSNITISGAGAGNTTIQANFSGAFQDRVFEITTSGINVQINNVVITGGRATAWGGALLNYGNLVLDRVHIQGNRSQGRGGGLYFAGGTSTVSNSTIYNNDVTGPSATSGGGIFVGDGNTTANLTVSNSTLSGNTVRDSGGGIGIYNGTGTAIVVLNHVTVAFNTANTGNVGGLGGGIALITDSGSLSLGNSIVSNNSVSFSGSGTNCYGTITSLDYNITGTSCGLSGTNDVVSDPLLVALANNGGPTLTHALGFSSLAIDTVLASDSATNGCGTTYILDQRGVTRPLDGNANTTADCDKGAFEAPARVCSIVEATPYSLGDVTFQVQTGGLGTIGCFQATQLPYNHPNATITNLQTGEYWLLEALTSGGGTASGYTLNLTIANLTFTADSSDKLCRWDGSAWGCGTTNSPSGTSITRTSVTALSPWTAGNNVGPTALQLQDLTVRPTNSTTHLALALIALIGLAAGVYLIRSRR